MTKSEVAYSVSPQLTLKENCLVVELAKAQKVNFIYNLTSPPEGLTANKWLAIATQNTDREAIDFLIKEELLYQKRISGKTPPRESFSFKYIHIAPSQIQLAFELLSATHKLFCNQRQLIVDLFAKTEFYYSGNSLPEGVLEVSGRLLIGDTDIALNDCIAVGPGNPLNWFIRGVSLKFIRPETLLWKQLKDLYITPFLLEGGHKQHFLDSLNEEEAPRFVLKEGNLDAIRQTATPYPILKLRDKWGTCADLWMDYGQSHLISLHDSSPMVINKEGARLFKRQTAAEQAWENDLLETDYIKKAVGTSHYYCPMNCIGKSLTFLLELGWKVHDYLDRAVVKQKTLDLQLEDHPQTITLKGTISYDGYNADLTQVLGAFNRKEHFIQLSNHTVGILPSDNSLKSLQEIAQEGECIGTEMRLQKNKFALFSSFWENTPLPSSLISLKEKWENFQGIQESPPSPLFKGMLRPYQQQGVNWMSFLYECGFHGILADEMGLGKTVQVLAFLSRLNTGPHLIIVPTSLLFNWRNEITHFLPHLNCTVHQGAKRAKSVEEFDKIDVILTSYTTLRLDSDLFKLLSFECLILDEAQMIKNAYTQSAQTVCQLQAQLRLCLTGTPVENHLQELWSHFHFLMPNLLGSQQEFEASIQAAHVDHRHLDRIKRKISPFILRRKKQQVASDLPERLEQTVWIEMNDAQRNCYEQLLAGFKSGLLKKVEADGISSHRLEVLEAILRLRQACCHPLLISSFLHEKEQIPSSAKFEALFQDLQTIVEEEHKVLIYSQFTSMLQLMAREAKKKNWNYCYLDGATKNREEVVTRFQEDPSQLLFFMSLKAGGVGLNLTSADYVYIYDPWWNQAVEEQAIGRAHRIGRKETIIAKRFVVLESVEEKIMKIKTAKQTIIDSLFDDEHSFTENSLSSQLTLDDLKALFS